MRKYYLISLISLLVLGATAPALYLIYSSAVPSETVRYRLTLEADIDGKSAVGSGVIEVTRQDTTSVFRTMGGFGAIVKGEAVALDLGDRGTAFALLHGRKPHVAEDDSFPSYVIFKAFENVLPKTADGIMQMRTLKQRKPKAEIPFQLLPLLVRFRDIDNPTSVEQVDPNNLSASFGHGVSLRRATIEITDDPVTTGIEARLKWLKNLGGRYLGNHFTSANAPLGLHAGNFKMGAN
jgi:hypothetical protein